MFTLAGFSGAAITITCTFFFTTESHGIHLVMRGMVTLLIAMSLYLVLLFGAPFSGDLKVSDAHFRFVRSFFDTPSVSSIDTLAADIVRTAILKDGQRIDGRKLDQVRPIESIVGFLPRTHGSVLFTRGNAFIAARQLPQATEAFKLLEAGHTLLVIEHARRRSRTLLRRI